MSVAGAAGLLVGFGGLWLAAFATTVPGEVVPLERPLRRAVRDVENALGVTGLALYRGVEATTAAAAWPRVALPLLVLLGLAVAVRRARGRSARADWGAAAVALSAASWLWPGAEPHALLVPLALALLACAGRERAP